MFTIPDTDLIDFVSRFVNMPQYAANKKAAPSDAALLNKLGNLNLHLLRELQSPLCDELLAEFDELVQSDTGNLLV